MTGQDLKNSILQLAIQGKLVEQREEEGTAQELRDRLKTEKEDFLSRNKLRRPEPLSSITDEERSFELPSRWVWIRLSDICMLTNGDKKKDNLSLPYLEARYLRDRIQPKRKRSGRCVQEGQNIILVDGQNSGEVFRVPEQGYLGSTFRILTIFPSMHEQFVITVLSYFKTFLRDRKRGAAIPHLDKELFRSLVVGLPPLEEQKRIVAKIEELMPYVDQYDQMHAEVEDLNTRFPSDMEKSILQYAIQGKLVEQREEEGTAEELYEQIQEEKKRLVKEGKIKKQKALPEIIEDETPFEIPESWKWCRIGSIFDLQAGKNITAADISDVQTDERKYPCYGGNGLRGYVTSFNRQGSYAMIGRQGALCGNINYATGDFFATEHAVVVDHVELTDSVWSAFFLEALNLRRYATATAQPGLAVSKIEQVLIPLPPFEEQKRIVAKIEELTILVKRLST